MSIVAPNIGLPIANPKAKNICIIPSIALYSLSPNNTPVIYDGPIIYANKDIPKHIGNTYPRKFIFGINIKHKHAITTNIPAKEYDLANPSLSNNIPPKIEPNIENNPNIEAILADGINSIPASSILCKYAINCNATPET